MLLEHGVPSWRRCPASRERFVLWCNVSAFVCNDAVLPTTPSGDLESLAFKWVTLKD